MSERPVALITGGARRLGRAIALELAGTGWDVAVHYRNSQQEANDTCQQARARGAHARMFHGDLAEEATCRRLLPEAVEAFGKVDAVINSASLFEYDDAATVTHESMERHWRSNTFPAIALAQALHTHLEARGGQASGCVVNLLDQKLWNINPDHLSYTLSKAALEAATQMLARALAPRVRVVGLAPGVTLASGPMSDADFSAAHVMTPLGRSSSLQDIAQAARFLLAAPAVTGTTLIVDGGQHMTGQSRDVMFLAAQQAHRSTESQA